MVKLGGHRPKARRAVGPWLLGGLLLPLLFGLATTARYEWSQLLLGRWQVRKRRQPARLVLPPAQAVPPAAPPAAGAGSRLPGFQPADI